MLWERPDYPGTKRNYYASVKKNTTKILLFSNILKQKNSTKEDSIRFWKSIGFTPNGKDEYDIPLFYKESRIILIALILDNEVQLLHDLYIEVQILHLRRIRGAK